MLILPIMNLKEYGKLMELKSAIVSMSGSSGYVYGMVLMTPLTAP